MLAKNNLVKHIALIVAFTFFVAITIPDGEAFAESIGDIRTDLIVGAVSELISEAAETDSVVHDFETDSKNALIYDGADTVVNVSKNPDDGVTLSDGLGECMSIGLPESLTVNVEVLTSSDGTVLYNSDDKNPDAELAVQALKDDAFEGVRLSMVINNSKADKVYDFNLDLPENHRIVTSSEYFGGEIDTSEVYIVDAKNKITQIVDAPWAKDANGETLDTYYTITGNTITQTVDFDENTAFPVVADPAIWDDVKCAAVLVFHVAAAFGAAKSITKLVKHAGSITKVVKVAFIYAKKKIKGASASEIKKAIIAAGYTAVTTATIYELLRDISGWSAIEKACFMEVY